MAWPARDGWQITGPHYLRREQTGATLLPRSLQVGRFCCRFRDSPIRVSVARQPHVSMKKHKLPLPPFHRTRHLAHSW